MSVSSCTLPPALGPPGVCSALPGSLGAHGSRVSQTIVSYGFAVPRLVMS